MKKLLLIGAVLLGSPVCAQTYVSPYPIGFNPYPPNYSPAPVPAFNPPPLMPPGSFGPPIPPAPTPPAYYPPIQTGGYR